MRFLTIIPKELRGIAQVLAVVVAVVVGVGAVVVVGV